jgi:hypothetical protein
MNKEKKLYDIIYDKLKDEPENNLSLFEYEIKKEINNEIVVDLENFRIGFNFDLVKDDLFIYEGITYEKSVIYDIILKVINDLIKEKSNG